MLIGYARVSTGEQDLRMQIDALQKTGCDKIYEESKSGYTLSDRGVLKECLSFMRPGDTLVVWAVDRLSRNGREAQNIVYDLRQRGMKFRSLQDCLFLEENGISPKISDEIAFGFRCMMAESERLHHIERIKAGMEAARKRGVNGGRPFKLDETQAKALLELYNSKKFSIRKISEMMKVSRGTIYNYVHQNKQ
jgi:DNA invertase Pin-like site-specific DNA recombinase